MPTNIADNTPNVNPLPSHNFLDTILGMFGSAKSTYIAPSQTPTKPAAPPAPVSQGNISEQNYNPGNLIFAGQPGAVKGAPKGDGTFWAKFADEKTGYQALVNDIQAKVNRQPNMTVAQLLDMRSPPSENSTSTLHYNVMDFSKTSKTVAK